METPPPEEINSTKPEPFPSMSTPALQSTAHSPNSLPRRPRRHTLARPDSALALLSDDLYNEDDTEEEQQEAFDRISDILSNLIQEANDAVHGIQREKAILTQQPKNVHKRSTYPSNSILLSRVSRIPRPSSSCSPSRKRMDTMDASAASPLSPPLTSASTSSSSSSVNTPSVRAETPSPPPPLLAAPSAPVSSVVKRARPVSMPVELRRRRDPLLESYERLDTHMALVESLSRDLAHPDSDKDDQDNTTPATSSRLSSALLVIPFLHIPHALISMVYDSLSSSSSSSSSSAAGMIAWAFFFALANIVVHTVPTMIPRTKVKNTPFLQNTPSRRRSLPGAYTTPPPPPLIVRRKPRTRRSIYRKHHARSPAPLRSPIHVHASTSTAALFAQQHPHQHQHQHQHQQKQPVSHYSPLVRSQTQPQHLKLLQQKQAQYPRPAPMMIMQSTSMTSVAALTRRNSF